MSIVEFTEIDPFDVRIVAGTSGLLFEFNRAGVITAADVHVASRLGGLAGVHDELVLLATALAVRAVRLGHVFVDLGSVRETAAVDLATPVDLPSLPWPSPTAWVPAVAASPVVAIGGGADPAAPLRLLGERLYLDRYWHEEVAVAADLLALSDVATAGVEPGLLRAGLDRLFPGDARSGRQAVAAAAAVLRRLAIVAGGPGTGKTTTVSRIVALLTEQALAAGAPAPLVALAAPTGKAAARLEEAVHESATELDVAREVKTSLLDLDATTLHRLLGWRPDSNSRFRHNRGQRLPHDAVIVDETSMVSLSQMARLVEAIRPDARLILVGDPDQLVSIEAGAVLGDIAGPARDRLLMRPDSLAALSAAMGVPLDAGAPPPGVSVGDGIVVLDRVHRFGGGIAELAAAIRRGDADGVMQLLSSGRDDVVWIPGDASTGGPGLEASLSPIRSAAVAAARTVTEAALAGAAPQALAALATFRLLCAHRRGPLGVAAWTAHVESWLLDAIAGLDLAARWYRGRPLLVTENDYELSLYNGDTGVVVAGDGDRVVAAFERGGEVVRHTPEKLGAVETVFAMTIHKAQGSQFDTAAVLLPEPGSRLLTRELLYTAATRARTRLMLAGTEEAVRAAVLRPVQRASGLGPRLWGGGT